MRANLSLVTLGVSDLPRAVRFYSEGLGLNVENDWRAQGVAFHVWEVAHNPFWTLDADGRVARIT